MTTVTRLRSSRGVMEVRCFESERGGYVAVLSDKTGGLLNGDREYRSEDRETAELAAITAGKVILSWDGNANRLKVSVHKVK